MANTGKYAYELLEQYNVITGLPTGTTKVNSPGDPNYVPPRDDLGLCPLKPVATVSLRSHTQFTGGVTEVNIILESNTQLDEDLLVDLTVYTRSGPVNGTPVAGLISAETGKWQTGYVPLIQYQEPYRYGYELRPGAGYLISSTEYAFIIEVPASTGDLDNPGGGGGDQGPINPGDGVLIPA